MGLALFCAGAAGCSTVVPGLPVTVPSTSAASTSADVPTFTMKGAFDLVVPPGSASIPQGTRCRGTGSYVDADEGDPVQVFDGSGHILATGSLSAGRFESNPLGTACVFDLTVENVPDGFESYSVEIGSHGSQSVNSSTAHSWVFLHVGPL